MAHRRSMFAVATVLCLAGLHTLAIPHQRSSAAPAGHEAVAAEAIIDDFEGGLPEGLRSVGGEAIIDPEAAGGKGSLRLDVRDPGGRARVVFSVAQELDSDRYGAFAADVRATAADG